MDEIFNLLSSSARIDKSKKRKPNNKNNSNSNSNSNHSQPRNHEDSDSDSDSSETTDNNNNQLRSRDRTGKRDTSQAKQQQVHMEQMAAFRRSMAIQLANKHDTDIPDPISSFKEIHVPSWWEQQQNNNNHKNLTSFDRILKTFLTNIEAGRWKEPTPIQMQSIPTLMERRDLIGAAPTGSGKSGAFILPALLLSSAPNNPFYAIQQSNKKKKKQASQQKQKQQQRQGEIRSLILAPSLELASQLHREVERLGMGKPGGLSSLLLSKSNAAQAISGAVGGKNGLDVLVSTPLRIVDAIQKGLKINAVRLVVLDEADRLLDAADGSSSTKEEASASNNSELHPGSSGSSQTKTFLSQMDAILSQVPASAVRALFSATVTPIVRTLSESILRNPIDLTIAANKGKQGGANPDIDQKLMFVGREEGKLLAIRQLVQRGELTPPAIIFLQSQDRAQALFGELLYDGIHVDVIHAGRSKSARENAVAKFRRGDTWVLICTDLVARGVDFRAVKMVINYDLPSSGVTYVHRIGRTGRAGRKGKAISLFTEADFDSLRTIANVMKQSGCEVEDWMLKLSRSRRKNEAPRRRKAIDTTPSYDKAKKKRKQQIIHESQKKKSRPELEKSSDEDTRNRFSG